MSDRPPEIGTLPGLRLAWGVIGLIALALLVFVGVGIALPGTWTVERSRDIDAPVEAVFPLLADLEMWDRWTHWPELQGRSEGTLGGVGASRSWDDPGYGSGVLTLTAIDPNRQVGYEVSVDEGAIEIRGRLTLEPAGRGSRVTWREEGDFGWNPLLAYMALTMDRMQGTEMQKSLDRLEAVVLEADPPNR